jgi:hypothetical protein
MMIVKDRDEMPEAMAALERQMAEHIVLVKAQDRPRCFFCASLNDVESKKCEGCGAPL